MRKSVILLMLIVISFATRAQEIQVTIPDSLRHAGHIGISGIELNRQFSADDAIPMSSSLDAGIVPSSVSLSNYGLYNPYRARPFGTYNNWITVAPFGYHYENMIEGGDIAGIGSRFMVSDHFAIGVGAYASSAYFGPFYPDRVNNLSFQLSLDYWLTEWLMVRGFGHVSVNEGINPMFMPAVGGGTGYGAGFRVMFTENLGVEGGVRRYYYKGKWHTSPYMDPVIEVKVRKKNPYPNLLPGK